MPRIGEIKRAAEVGFNGRRKMVWAACVDCGAARWVWLRKGQPQSQRCFPCGKVHGGEQFRGRFLGPNASAWKGGKTISKEGYVIVTLHPSDPLAIMAPTSSRNLRVREHRLVVARHLGRPLEPFEIVHHKNGNKQDNRIENLALVDHRSHAKEHHKVDELITENIFLRQENQRLMELLNAEEAVSL